MENLQILTNDEFGTIRSLDIDGKVWFCGKDVTKVLGYQNPNETLSRHCRNYGVAFHDLIDNLSRTQSAKFIDEGNLYRLITHSKLPSAERFESWVFDEVLPQIRTTGSYTQHKVSDEQLIEIARIISKCSNHNLPYVLEVLQPILPHDFKGKVARCRISKNKPYLPDNFNVIFNEAVHNTGLSIKELERKTGVSRQSIYRYMNGDKPTRKILDKLRVIVNIEYI